VASTIIFGGRDGAPESHTSPSGLSRIVARNSSSPGAREHGLNRPMAMSRAAVCRSVPGQACRKPYADGPDQRRNDRQPSVSICPSRRDSPAVAAPDRWLMGPDYAERTASLLGAAHFGEDRAGNAESLRFRQMARSRSKHSNGGAQAS